MHSATRYFLHRESVNATQAFPDQQLDARIEDVQVEIVELQSQIALSLTNAEKRTEQSIILLAGAVRVALVKKGLKAAWMHLLNSGKTSNQALEILKGKVDSFIMQGSESYLGGNELHPSLSFEAYAIM